ncbi:MAG TPA: beta-ketoacyl synthase N-terminal-like domain-containing protein [Thermoanaerobaculia bacterium]|nr:beta-ketoacyl synthase N-terminal-like domain-containing protein [Thermoanaerobaculia bacterium]
MDRKDRVAIAGWGVIAPKCRNVDEFEQRLESSESWLEPFDGFGPDNFLVGRPSFDLADYRGWIEERFPPRRYAQIVEKLGMPIQYAIGAFIQALGQNRGVEQWLQELGTRARVYVGTGIGDIETIRRCALRLDAAQREWDAFWAGRGDDLTAYLDELREIESRDVEGDVETGKRSTIRRKRNLVARLQEKWGTPDPPWSEVPAELLWNIHNGPASQVSMIGRITGLSFAPVAACSTFGVALELAMNAIRVGHADVVVVGAVDPPPNPLVVGAFYSARVISADATVSKPLTGLRGTHISGGAALWIVGRWEAMKERGFRPLGLEPVAVGVSSDADHVITPSVEGPLAAIRMALGEAGVEGGEVGTWDLHATATPGDITEVETLRRVLPEQVLVTARKGTFGHGMAVGGGWELTAQHLGLAKGILHPTPLAAGELNSEIAKLHTRFVTDVRCGAGDFGPAAGGRAVAGKLSMGVGGVNACVVSRPWDPQEVG